MRTFVWVDSWQHQCCGDDFRVGTEVSWRVVRRGSSREWVDRLLGRSWPEQVAYHQEHHEDDVNTEITGTVRSIREVTCRRTPELRDAREVWVPVPGSGRLTEVDVADKWCHESPDALPDRVTFDGWIVELEDATLASVAPR